MNDRQIDRVKWFCIITTIVLILKLMSMPGV